MNVKQLLPFQLALLLKADLGDFLQDRVCTHMQSSARCPTVGATLPDCIPTMTGGTQLIGLVGRDADALVRAGPGVFFD